MYNKVVLVNKNNPIKEKYLTKVDLVVTKDVNDNEIKVEKEAYNAYLKLKSYLETKNIIMGLTSAFRNTTNQTISEHCTGLALDITIYKNNQPLLNNKNLLNEQKTFKTIHEVLKEFGFILRYPEGKEDITGYSYTPWHLRYVGKVPAKIIYENNWTLEEYLNEFSAIIVVNKEKDLTSFDVVNEISHLFGIKKVGHTGTLDPLAEGVLIVAIGKATKIVELLTMEDKEYIASVQLGVKTDTYDITGTILGNKEIPDLKNLETILHSYKKTYLQEVPIYSAIKVNGKKLYEYARNKVEVVLPQKEVTIKEIELLTKTSTTFEFKTLVSKGTYIRSLINDIGLSLKTYATMTSLKRTKQGKVTIEEAYKLEDIKKNNFKYYSPEEVLPYKIIIVNGNLEKKIRTGCKLEDTWNISDKVIFKDQQNHLLGIYEKKENQLIVWKNFV